MIRDVAKSYSGSMAIFGLAIVMLTAGGAARALGSPGLALERPTCAIGPAAAPTPYQWGETLQLAQWNQHQYQSPYTYQQPPAGNTHGYHTPHSYHPPAYHPPTYHPPGVHHGTTPHRPPAYHPPDIPQSPYFKPQRNPYGW